VPSDQTLSDDQLIAVAKSGDSSLLRALNPDEKNRLIALSRQQDVGPGPSGRGPHGYPVNELGQEVTDAKGSVYKPGMFQRGVDYVSDVLTHPTPGMQLAGDVAATLAGRFAGGMRPGAMDTQNELTLRGEGLKGYAQGGMQKIADMVGLDSDARDIKALNVRKAALRSTAKQIKTTDQISRFGAEPVNAAGRVTQPTPTDPPVLSAQPTVSAQGVPASAQGIEASQRAEIASTVNPRRVSPAAAPSAPPPAPAPETPAPKGSSPNAPAAMSPQRLMNEVALQARRQGVQLAPAEDAAAQALVRERGLSPADAVATVKQATSPIPPRLDLSPEEQLAYQTALKLGKSPAEAVAGIQQARALQSALGTTSGASMADRVAQRNATGRWPGE